MTDNFLVSIRIEAMKMKRVSKLVLCLILFLHAKTLALHTHNNRILGGEDSNAGEYPWAVSIRRNNAHICTGSIISNTKILTAGHCVSQVGTEPVPLSEITVRVGSINQFAGGIIVGISNIIIHPSYGNFMHDIAIITLTSPLTFGEKINKIDLPLDTEGSNNELADGAQVYVQGWGELLTGTASYKLQNGVFNILGASQCELQAGYGYDSILCLHHPERRGICRGDDGAGVISDENKLVGVVSFFFGNCGTKYPDVASKVVYYLDWINNNLL